MHNCALSSIFFSANHKNTLSEPEVSLVNQVIRILQIIQIREQKLHFGIEGKEKLYNYLQEAEGKKR